MTWGTQGPSGGSFLIPRRWKSVYSLPAGDAIVLTNLDHTTLLTLVVEAVKTLCILLVMIYKLASLNQRSQARRRF